MAKKVKRVKKVMNMQRRPSAKAAVQAAAQSSSESTTYYVHGPRGILAQKDSSQNWEWMMQDGLGSVRSVVDNSGGVEWSGSPDPFGGYFGEAGTRQTPYGFTGEYTDPITGMVHLRARDYHPALGVFPALDPLETFNRYSYVQGNPINRSDPSGMTDVVVDEPEVPAILVSGGNSGGMPAIWQVPVEGVRLENAERLVSNGYNMTPNFFAPPGTVLYTAPTSSMGRVNPIAQSALLQFDHVAQYQSNVMSGSVRLLIGYNENAIDVAKGFVQRIGDVGTFVQLSDTYLLYQDPYHMGQLTGSIRTSVPTPAPQTVTLPQLAQQAIPNMLLLPTILCGCPVQVQAAVATATGNIVTYKHITTPTFATNIIQNGINPIGGLNSGNDPRFFAVTQDRGPYPRPTNEQVKEMLGSILGHLDDMYPNQGYKIVYVRLPTPVVEILEKDRHIHYGPFFPASSPGYTESIFEVTGFFTVNQYKFLWQISA